MEKRSQFALSKNFALYYGFGRANELFQYDIAIIEPAGHTSESLRELKSTGTLAIAYLSVMELPPWSEDNKNLETRDFLHVEGEKYVNKHFGNFWVDLRSPRWVGLLFEHVQYIIEVLKYDGLFLDTVGYVESLELTSELRAELFLAATKIISNIRKKYPDCILIQNCGLENLLKHTARYLDGVCWENPPFNQAYCDDWVANIIDALVIEKRDHNLQVLLLVEENNLIAQDFHLVEKVADEKKFLVYKAPSFYTAGVSKKIAFAKLKVNIS